MRLFFLISCLFLTACAQTSSGEISNLLERRWTWTDFISAGDVRRACEVGSADTIRFVLNADRSKQVRIYDFDTAASTLRIRVHRPRVSLKEIPLDSSLFSRFSPADFQVALDAQAVSEIKSAWSRDRAAKQDVVPDPLLTEWHFWLVGACVDGSFQFDVWVAPDPDYIALKFPSALLARDVSNIPVVRSGADQRLGLQDYNPARQDAFSHYMLHLREDRVVLGQLYGQDRSDR